MKAAVKWAAELLQVREVSLLGTADLVYWRERLRPEGLIPAESAGAAQILVIAADMKFKRVRFSELSFSVLVASGDGPWREAAFLVQAFNSNRLFAFCERTMFATPYRHGDVRVSAEIPPSMQLAAGGEVVFRAAMAAGISREPSYSGDRGWDGPIFLPRRRDRSEGKLFFARLQGETQTHPFLHAEDVLTIEPRPAGGILQALADSHFKGGEWIVRANATHAKSRTYRRSESGRFGL